MFTLEKCYKTMLKKLVKFIINNAHLYFNKNCSHL